MVQASALKPLVQPKGSPHPVQAAGGSGGSGGGGTGGGEPPEGPDDAEILRLWRSGQPRRALDLLVRRDGALVYSLCRRVLRDDSLAEDVMHQVFIQALRDLDRFLGRSNLRGWLLGIASHRCLDALRSLRTKSGQEAGEEEAAELAADEAEPQLEALHRRQLLEALEECMGALSPEARLTLLRRFQSGLSYPELSLELDGAQPATLQARVARSLPVLRECLEKKGFTP